MPFFKKHGRLIQILLIVSIPIVVSFCSGFWLSHLFTESQQKGEDGIRYKKIGVESQMLSDQLSQRLELFKIQAQWMGDLKKPAQALSAKTSQASGLRAWGELEMSPGLKGVQVKRFFQAPSVEKRLETEYLSRMIKEMSSHRTQVMADLENYGFHLPESSYDDAFKSGYGFSFLFQSLSDPKNVYLVLVDPSAFFSPFQSWVKHSQGGLSQSALFVLGKGVLVQSHPQQSLWKKLDEEPFFHYQMENVLKKVTFQTRGDFKLESNSWVRTSFIGFKNLPWAIAVSDLKLAPVKSGMGSGMVWLFAALLGLLILVCTGLASLYLSRNLVQLLPFTVVAPHSETLLHPHPSEEDSMLWAAGSENLKTQPSPQSGLDH